MPNQNNEDSSNSELVQELIKVLKKEASLFETFLELLDRQQQVLVKGDMEELNRLTELLREKTICSAILARKREEIIRRLSSETNLAEDLTVSRLIDSVQPGQASVLDQIRETILDLNDKIGRRQTQNKMLINRSRDNIMKTMQLLAQLGKPGDNYHRGGKADSSSNRLTLDRRA
jgi:hypothetical protein